MPHTADTAVLLLTIGLLLLFVECLRPGRVIPGSVGLLLLLLGIHRLTSLPLRPSALLLTGAAVLLLALLLRPQAPWWIGIVSTLALITAIPRLVDTRTPGVTLWGVTLWIGALSGLLLGLSSSLLLRIAARARANKYSPSPRRRSRPARVD